MSRVSQFIEYINRKHAPSDEEKLGKYTDITIDRKMKKIRRKHKKKLKEKNERT